MTKRDNILITIIVPTYKRSDKIDRAIQSVLCQTYQNFEIIIVNDNEPGSVNDISTRECVRKYYSEKRLTMISTSGKIGGGAARNLACKNASGSYLAFLDDDDMFLPDKLETQLTFMLENDLDMSYQDIAWYTEAGKLVEFRKLDHAKSSGKEDLLRAHLLTPISPTAIYMLKKELFNATEGFGEVPTGQDWFLMLRCIEANARIGYMSGVHVRQFLHERERLSLGQNKIDGENARHEFIKDYYSILSDVEIRYVKFRHFAVLAFATMRCGMRLQSVVYALRAFITSPYYCLKETKKFFFES